MCNNNEVGDNINDRPRELHAGFIQDFSPGVGGERHYYHSMRSTPILGGSGGMLTQENF